MSGFHWVGRVAGLFDMYSQARAARLTVAAAILAGGALLAFGRVEGAIPFIVLIAASHERFFERMADRFSRRPWLLFTPALVIMAVQLAYPAPAAIDDLLRHIASGFYPGGYRDMYVYSNLPQAGLYPAFDWMAGGLGRLLQPLPALWTIQGLAWSSFVVVFLLAAHRVLPAGEDRAFWLLGALVLVVSALVVRLSLARPEIFMTVWALTALLARGRLGIALWCATGLLMGTGYWLAPLYFVTAVLLPGALRTRLACGAVLTAAWVLGWQAVTGVWPWQNLQWLWDVMRARDARFNVGENMSVINLLAMPEMLVLIVPAIWTLARRGGNGWLLALAVFYALSNQARYVGMIAPLLALYILSALTETRLPWRPPTRFVALIASMVLTVDAMTYVPRLDQLPRLGLPDGAVMLSGFNSAAFAAPFFNPGTVRLSPPMEVGAAEPWVQQIIGDLHDGRFDCKSVEGRAFTHLVEFSLRGSPPPCLELVETDGGWRLWKIRGQGAATTE
ncbi:MAG: hypothetical protein JSW68_08695 [Burkholderiales bacterium]|nr:MAG: hypothetical protein JSW68_08695 [Burkholderiales bacterium]